MSEIKCFFGFHSWAEINFHHCDDQAQHNLICCMECGAVFVTDKLLEEFMRD